MLAKMTQKDCPIALDSYRTSGRDSGSWQGLLLSTKITEGELLRNTVETSCLNRALLQEMSP